jgi:hypothetical protein
VTLSQPQSNGKATNLPFVIPSAVEGSAVTLSQPQSKGKATNLPFVIPSAVEGSAVTAKWHAEHPSGSGAG